MKKICFTFVLSSFAWSVFGQGTLRPNIYFQDMNYYNPSAIAMDTSQNYSVSLYGKHKFVDNDEEIWNKRASFFLNHIGRIGNSNSFYTVSYISDRYSFFNRNTLYLGYAHQIKCGKSSTLSLGGRAVFNGDFIRWNKFEAPHSKTGKTLAFSPDIDLGIQYQVKGFTAGISTKNLIGLTTRLDGEEILKNRREVYLNASYSFRIGNNFKIAPFALWYWERKSVLDAGLSVSFFNRVSASYILRIHELRGVYGLDVRVYKGVNVGLALDRSKLFPDNNLDFVVKYNF